MVIMFLIVTTAVFQLVPFHGSPPPVLWAWQSLVAYRRTRRPRTHPRKVPKPPAAAGPQT
jgi:hypothetical protein